MVPAPIRKVRKGPDDDTPVINVSGPLSVNEGDGVATFTISLSNASEFPITVDYATVDGTAVAGSDFTAASGSVTFAPGETSVTVDVPITDDLVVESDEAFSLDLSNVQGDALIGSGSAETAILDNEGSTTFNVQNVSVSEGSTATITVTRSGDAQSEQTVEIATLVPQAGVDSAEASDFVANTATLTFAAGQTTATFTVDTTSDDVYEGAETFRVELSNPSEGAQINDGTGVVTILDDGNGPDPDGPEGPDDDRPSFSINDVTVDESAGTITFTVTKTGDTELDSSVNYAVSPGTATNPEDYTPSDALTGTLSFAAGVASQTVTLAITDDVYAENQESFTVQLSSPSGAIIADGIGSGIINDDADVSTVTLSSSDVNEGSDITVTATVDNAPQTTDLVLTLNNGETITIAAGATQGSVTFANPNGSDDVVDGETLTYSIASGAGGNYESLDTSDTVDVVVSDDPLGGVTVDLTATASLVEGNDITYTATLSGGTAGNDITVTLANGEAITIEAGQTSGSTTAATREDEEYIQGTATITNSITTVVETSSDAAPKLESVAAAADTSVSTSVTDDADVSTVTLSSSDVNEGSDITVTATVDNAPQTTDLVLTLNNGETITIAAGATQGSVTFANPNGSDDVVDGETLTYSIASGAGGNYESLDTADTVDVVVSDDPLGGVTVDLTATASLVEGNDITYTATLSGGTAGNDITVTLANGEAITIEAGQTSGSTTAATREDEEYIQGTATITNSITTVVETSSDAAPKLESVAAAADTSVSTSVTDDADVSTVTLSSSDVNEGSDITVTATVDNAPQTTDLVLTLNNGETITIAAGATQGSVTFANPNGSDDVVDGETLTYSIASGAGGNYESLDTSDTVDVVVSDDPLGGVTVDLTATASLVEGNDITYTATLSGGTAGNDITVTLANGEAITIEAGQTSGSTTAATREDEEYIQGTATITNSITTVVETSSDAAPKLESVAAAADTSVSTSVTDDADVSTVTLSSSDVNEGSDITVTATVDNAPQTTDLVLTLNNGETITIAAGATQGSVTFANPNGSDDVVDGETLTYSIASGAGGNYESLNTDDTVDVVVSDALSATVSGDIATQDADVLANTTDSGTAQVTGTGGSGGYTYAFADTAVTSVVAGDFSIDANGLVTFTQDAAYQHDPNSDQADNVYSIDIVITDSDGNSVTRTVNVDITDDTPHLAPFGGSDEVAMGGSVVIDSSANSSFGGDGPGYYTLTTSTDGVASLTENNGVWTGYHSNGDALFNLALTEDGWLFTSIARLSEQTPVQLNSGSIGAFSPTGEVIIGDLTISSPDGSINGTGNGIGVGTSGNDAEFDFGDHMTFAFEGPQTSVEVGMSGSKAGTVTAVFYDADGNVIETQSGLVFDKATGSSPPSPIALATSQGTAFYAVTIEHTADNNGSNKVEFIEYNQVSASDAYSFVVLITDADGDQSSANFNVSVVSANPPIAVDIAGDGVDYLPMDAGVVFTDQSTGESVNTAWVGPEDGMLVIDANNSGTVDEAREYVFTEWSETAQTDMEAVAEVFDTNQDGVLDAQDERFDEFAVWQDADSDGVTDEGELTSLTDLGIESIALNYAEDSESGTAADGDVVIHGQSEVVFTDGTTTTAEDTSFAISAADVISDEGDLALPASEEAALVPGASDAEAGGRSGEFDTLMVEADLMLNSNRDEGVDDSSNQ